MSTERRILDKLATKREYCTAKPMDVYRILWAQDVNQWETVHMSRLYKNHPTEYCQLLECIEVERMKALEVAKNILTKISSKPATEAMTDLAWLEDNTFIDDGEFAQFVTDPDDHLFIDMVDDAIITLIRKVEKL